MKKIKYDIKKYPFINRLKELFKVDDLSEIRNDEIDVLKRENDQSTFFHKEFYMDFHIGDGTGNSKLRDIYDNFIKDIVLPLYDESIVVQKTPTFRIHFPNNIAVGEFHKDKWYRDKDWADDVKEDNFFLPFTNAFGTNTIWVESEEDKGDYVPMLCNYDEVIQWDGSNLMHGNRLNLTDSCRISVDFRVIKYSNYKPSEHGSINMNNKFQIGGYYYLIEK